MPPQRLNSSSGQELQAGRDPDGGAAAVGELEYQPVLGDALHPGTGVRDHLTGREQPEVTTFRELKVSRLQLRPVRTG